MNDNNRNGLQSRLAALETSYTSLHADVVSLGRALERFSEETRNSMRQLVEQITQTQRPQWGVLASWAGVLIALVGLLGGTIAYSINEKVYHSKAVYEISLSSLKDELSKVREVVVDQSSELRNTSKELTVLKERLNISQKSARKDV